MATYLVVFSVASVDYPGGSENYAYYEGYSFFHNFLCDVMNPVTQGGTVNNARGLAIVSHIILSITMICFFYILPDIFSWKNRNTKLVRLFGVLTMTVFIFMFTSYHDSIVVLTAVLGTIALVPFFIELSEIIDFTFISNVGQLDLYRKNGCKNVDYWQYGVDVNKAKPLSTKEKDVLKSKYNHDIVFCANSYDGFPGYYIRKSIVSEVYKKYGSRFAIYGNGWDTIAKNSSKPNIKYFEQNNVYNSSKIVLSINNFNDIEMYFSGRQLLAMASGTLTLSHYIPGLERYFENGKDLVWFKTEDECMKLIDYYLNNEGEAKRIGLNGSAKVLKEHSYEARIKELGIKLGFINE